MTRIGSPAERPSCADGGPPASRSRPFCNGPQPRSWGKPGRDAKSVVPGLRPGDRRARRRWPAAAGLFGLRVFVACETVTGVVIGLAMCRAADPPVGGPAAPVEVCHSACEMGRSPKRGRIPNSADAGRTRPPRTGGDGPATGKWTRRLRRRPWLCCRGERDLRPDGRPTADRPVAHKYTKSRVQPSAM